MLGEHLWSHIDADTSDTGHVFSFGPAQSDPVDQSFPWRQFSLANRSPRCHTVSLLCVVAKLWHGYSAFSQAERHVHSELGILYI